MRIVAAGGADITVTSPLQAAGADALTNSTSGIPTYDLLSGFNGATWDRLRALGDDSDGVAAASLGRLLALVRLSGYNGASWDRLLSEGNDRDGIANTTLGNLQTLGFPHGYNGATWDRLLSEGNDRDAIANSTLGNLQTLGFPHGYNGATWDRLRTLGGTSLDGLGQAVVSLAVPGASVVKMLAFSFNATSTTRKTLIAPTSGKRVRISSISCMNPSGTATTIEIYFGTGDNALSDNTKGIFGMNGDLDAGMSGGLSFGDGQGPIGAADEVVSGRTGTNIGAEFDGVIVYREE